MTLTDGIAYEVQYLRDGRWEKWATYCYLAMAWGVAERISHEGKVARVAPVNA